MRIEPQYRKGQDRLAQILAAAETVINEKGVFSFTTHDVADAAGCAIGTLYRYFNDRNDIIDALAPSFRNEAEVLFNIARLTPTKPADLAADANPWSDA